MRVKTWAEIDDVEVTVDVTTDEVLTHFSNEIEEAYRVDETRPRSVMLPAIDWCTKLMARIPDKAVAEFTDDQRTEIISRLRAELDRYELANVSAMGGGVGICQSGWRSRGGEDFRGWAKADTGDQKLMAQLDLFVVRLRGETEHG